MKKLVTYFFATVIAISSFSCKNDDGYYIDYDTYSVAYDLNNVNFEFLDGVYQIQRSFTNPLYSYDMMLVYMRVGTNGDAPIWQQIPITMYLEDGHEVDYNYDFSRYDFVIYAGGTFDLGGSELVKNKTFRILIVPADPGKSMNPLDYSNYEAVVDYFKIDDSNPEQL